MKSYKYRNKVYTVKHCTIEDIPSHLERVLPYWDSDDINIQLERMNKAVEAKTTFKLVDESESTLAFIYYEQISESQITMIAAWHSSLKMFSILVMHGRSKTNVQYLYFNPHKLNNFPYEFIIEVSSIMSYHLHNTPLRINLYSKQFERLIKLYEKMNVEGIVDG